jgi:RNA polymerase sigma-70 factor (ECF subfamily)
MPGPTLLLDADGITRLYRRNAETLLIFFQRRVHDPERAVDLVADTFEIVIARREQFRGRDESELSGWLWRIAQSVLTGAQAREHREEEHERTSTRQRRALTDQELERVEELAGTLTLRTAVTQHLGDLPLETRAAVQLHVVDGLSYAAVGRRLGIRQDAARARVHRALRTLRDRLGPALDDWRGGR